MKGTNLIRVYSFSPQYISFTDTVFDKKKLHATQEALLGMGDMEEDCLLLHAPTGSGKTYGFGLPSLRYEENRLPDGSTLRKTLIITPTNALIGQTKHDLEKDWEHKNLKVVRLSAKDIVSKGWNRALDMYNKIREADIIVSNPDIITLLVGSFYYRRGSNTEKNIRLTQWSTIFKTIQFIIFDEYHIYAEDEIAKIISFLLLSRATGNSHIKACFSSATPNEKIKDLLEQKYGFKCKEVVQKLVETIDDEGEYRKVKGNLKVVFTDQDIFRSLPDVVSDNRRTLFIFDNLKKTLEAQDMLTKNKIEFGSFTGLDTPLGQVDPPKERIILATNKAELGLNLGIKLAHITPGFYAENFWQRFGRNARNGEDGEIVVHVSSGIVGNLPMPEDVKTYKEFVQAVDKVLVTKDVYASKILDHIGAFLYLVKINSTIVLANQVHAVANNVPGEKMYKAFEAAEFMLKEIKCVSDRNRGFEPKTIDALLTWWNEDFVKSFGWFRGQAVEALYSSHVEPHKEPVPYSLKWIQENCIYEIIRDRDGRRIYKSTGFHEVKRSVKMSYEWCTGQIIMEDTECYKNEPHREKWRKAFKEIERLTRDDDEELNEIMQKFVELFTKNIVRTVHVDLLKPVGVDVIDNFI